MEKVRQREKQEPRTKRGHVVALVAAMALGAAYISYTDKDPSCEGRQIVMVGETHNQTLDGIKYKYVNVPKGEYVDLDRVDSEILKPPNNPGYPGDDSRVAPGDTVIIPKTCK